VSHSLYHRRRTFDDFDGNKYKWSTSLFGDQEVWLMKYLRLPSIDLPRLIQCRRVSDGALIASFKKAKLSMNNWVSKSLNFPYAHRQRLFYRANSPSIKLSLR